MKQRYKPLGVSYFQCGQLMSVSLESIYAEIKLLRREMELLRSALIPEEKVSGEEIRQLRSIEVRMKRGEKVKLKDALEELDV